MSASDSSFAAKYFHCTRMKNRPLLGSFPSASWALWMPSISALCMLACKSSSASLYSRGSNEAWRCHQEQGCQQAVVVQRLSLGALLKRSGTW